MAARADIKALEEAAKKEGELTWYVAHYTSEGAEDLGRGFTEMYGVKVNVVRTTAQVAYQRLLQDLKNNQTICDVFSSTDVGHYVRLAAEGRFEKYVPETESKILPTFRNFDPAGFYHTTSAGLVVLTYNSTKVKAEEAPKKWQDLLDIKWKGKVSTGHPGFSGYVGTWVLTMKNLYGWAYFDKLEKNKPQIGRSINDTVTALNRRRAPGGGRRRRLDPVQRVARQSARGVVSERRLGADHRALGDHEGHASIPMPPSSSWSTSTRSRRRRSTPSISPFRCARSAVAAGRQADQRDQDHPPDHGRDRQGRPRGHRAMARHFGMRLRS